MVCKFKQIVLRNIIDFEIGNGVQVVYKESERLNTSIRNHTETRFIERMVKYYTNKNE